MDLLNLVHMSYQARVSLTGSLLDIEVPDGILFHFSIGNISSYPVLDKFTELLFASGGTMDLIKLFEKLEFHNNQALV